MPSDFATSGLSTSVSTSLLPGIRSGPKVRIDSMTVEVTTRKFTLDEYNRMAEAGILTEDDRVELIEGEIVEMPPIGDRHRLSVDRLGNYFASQIASSNFFVSVQQPLPINQASQPRPDLILIRGKPEDYSRHPGIESAILVIEVGD